MNRIIKESFVVIGKEGSTLEGPDFIKQLWSNANSNFKEIEAFTKRNKNGKLVGIWGTMSDLSKSFMPWEDNYSKGLYLAGVECNDDSIAPPGWTKWVIPGYEYLVFECTNCNTFTDSLLYLTNNNLKLVGAVHDFTDPSSGKNYMYFPIRKLCSLNKNIQ